MKTIKIIGALIITTLSVNSLWAQNGEKEKLVVPLSNPGKPYKLEVGLVNGSITVTGYEGKDIVIETQAEERKGNSHDERGYNDDHGMRRIGSNNNSDVHAQENNNEVNVSGSLGRKTGLVIRVPMSEASLKLHTVNNGNIIGNNLNGELEVTNVNGFIQLHNISGSVVANTVNGKVEVTFKTIDAKAAMAFSTLNGNVDVTFPASLKASVKLKSDRGDIYTDFDVVTDPHKPSVTRENQGGMYSLKIDDWVYGKISGGGPEILMKNMQGSIYIRKAK